METIDEHFVRRMRETGAGAGRDPGGPVQDPGPAGSRGVLSPRERQELLACFEAQLLSRHIDFACRALQARGEAFYTIGSSGHESNAAVALALRPTDPALLHYRSGGFYTARAGQVPGTAAAQDILSGAMSSTSDPISGGRHKVFGSVPLNVIPQTSTIASHLPRAFGLAYALDSGARHTTVSPWPADAVVISSFGDASANHSTALGALNAAAYCAHRRIPLPILFVCEDNGLGISTKSPAGWVENLLRSIPGVDYFHGSGTDPRRLLRTAHEAAAVVRTERRPAVLHLKTVRLMGHAGSDAEIAYRSRREIQAEYAKDPLLATARALTRLGVLSPADVLDRYETVRAVVADTAARIPRDHLASASAVTAPLTRTAPEEVRRVSLRAAPGRADVFRARLPEQEPPQTLAQIINATLKDAMAAFPETLVFGEDVGRKGGVYGVTRGLRKTFGPDRVFDTLLDEQTVLGMALGSALAGFLPVPEIQYLAYLHNAEDQLRGEAASLRFFSAGQYENGMVVRVAGLAYQKGFGGHFHNDNSLAVLRDIPGLVLAVPSHPAFAGGLLRHCLALARTEGRVCVFLEPIALYHQRDLFDGDAAWLAPYPAPTAWETDDACALGRARRVRDGRDLLLVTFGNGVRMSRRAAATLAGQGVDCAVLDLQWLSPLPEDDLLTAAAEHTRVLVVDETRRSGGVAEQVVAALLDRGYPGRIARVTGSDSYIPLGPAADHVLLSEDDIVTAATALARHPAP